jgi:tetratricopeptide (TPR) repeat protein
MDHRLGHRLGLSFAAVLLAGVAAVPALAGETIIYDAAPAWVDVTPIEPKAAQSRDIIILLDQQARIEKGRLWTYVDTAIALDSPEALTRFGTLNATWSPDKGDLIVHRVELIRDGAVIDVLSEGAKFEVLRRERGLEARLLNGALTATLAAPGAKLGDILRLAYSTTLSDQVMGDNVQWQGGLIAKPVPLKAGRVAVSWPEDLPVSRLRLGNADVAEPTAKGGFLTWSASLPVAEAPEVPKDSPLRFQLGELLQVSTYADWAAVSRNHAEHYGTDGQIASGGDLAVRIAGIAAESSDPLTRAALALRMVQDDVSYLLNGMNGGNYIPQLPEETWSKRFGDCKAKTLLLLTILRELGIEAEATLVRTEGGDALPQLAPMPGNFDHVIVRAMIDGENYWLDGTTAGTRLDTINEVPRFFHALPLRADGADLMPLGTRKQTAPDQTVRLTLDHSAGLRVPSVYTLEIEYRGANGAGWRTVAEQVNEDLREDAVYDAVNGLLGDTLLVDHTVRYDADAGLAVITARGLRGSDWERDGSAYSFEPPAQIARNVGFDVDRARAAWRAIPLRLNGPIYFTGEYVVVLPDDQATFTLEGTPDLAATIGGVEIGSGAQFDGERLAVTQTMRTLNDELSADVIGAARRELTRFDRQLPVLKSSGEVRQQWQYFGRDRTLLAPLEALYDKAVADADPDDTIGLTNRANFRAGIYDHAGALADIEAALAIEDSRDLYVSRGGKRWALGDIEGALADFVEAEALQPDGSTYSSQIYLLALLGRAEEGVALAEDFEGITKDRVEGATILATALGWLGEAAQGLVELDALVAQRPTDGTLLNAICWHAATWSLMDEERLAICTQGVEKSDYSPGALDSRALAHLRLGNLTAAKADVDAALLAEPGLSNSMLLRGIILTQMGDKSGKDEIALALAMQPSLARIYKAWGLKF